MSVGRPTKYTPKIAERIMLRMYEGETLRKICQDESMPARSTVHLWRIRNKDFSDQYAHARRAQVEARMEDAAEIADELPTCRVPDPDGGVSTRIDGAGIQRNRLRVDLAKWEASKLLHGMLSSAPLDYGDKVEVHQTGDPLAELLGEFRRAYEEMPKTEELDTPQEP